MFGDKRDEWNTRRRDEGEKGRKGDGELGRTDAGMIERGLDVIVGPRPAVAVSFEIEMVSRYHDVRDIRMQLRRVVIAYARMRV
jgi:hypothetical protein